MSGAGDEAIDLAASAGLILDDWQRWWLDNALAEQANGDWCARENVIITGRQSGKNACLAALELTYLFTLGDRLVMHSAHEVPTALNHFSMMLDLIDATPDLSKKCARPTYTNGKEAVNLMSGATLQFRARGNNSGRGLTAQRMVFDEAFSLKASSMGAMLPTMRAVRNAQTTYASSAPKSSSVVLHSLIARGRADDSSDRLFFAEWGNPPGTEMDDEDAWAHANPALGLVRSNGTGVTIEAIRDEYRTLVAGGNEELIAEFSREALGVGEAPPSETESLPVKLPSDAWAKTARPANTAPDGVPRLAFDVAQNGSWCSIAVALGSLSDPWVEIVEHAEGVGWLPARLAELAAKYDSPVIGCDGVGPTAAVLPRVREALELAGVPVDRLQPLTSAEYRAACGAFYADVVEGRLRRPAPAPGVRDVLDVVAADAAERLVGDGWVWDRRRATVPVSPLVAVTVARSLLAADVTGAHDSVVFDLDDYLVEG